MTQRLSIEAADEALRAQVGLQQIWEACGEPIGGWKVGITSSDPRSPGDNREQFEPGYRPFGFVLASRILPTGATVPRQAIQMCHVEPELCAIIGEPVSGTDVSPDQARRAVRAIAPTFEINELRHAGKHTPLPVRIATGLNNWGMVVGEPIDPPRWDVRTTTVSVCCNDGEPEVTTLPEGAIDDPYVSLSRLCARLAVFGKGLREGDRVLTGAFSHHTVPATSTQTWSASFSGIGTVEVTFTASDSLGGHP